MTSRHLYASIGVVIGAAVIAPIPSPTVELGGAQGILERFATRFESEIYPLLERSVNGCRACHNGESAQTFQVLESPVATFSLLLERDLLDIVDPMSIPARVSSTDEGLRMPQAGHLDDSEVGRIRRFSEELAQALEPANEDSPAPPDERFPISLMLAYDGQIREERVRRRMSYYQLRRSFETLFGRHWLETSGPDPFQHKAAAFGGADFQSSFEASRAVSANYLAAIQQVSREVSRRYVSAKREVLFNAFDPNADAAASRKRAARNVRALYERILFRKPSARELERSLELVRNLQGLPVEGRTVRFTLDVADERERRGSKSIDVKLRPSEAKVTRIPIDQTRVSEGTAPWMRIGESPFRFKAANVDHFIRLVARPGNHVTAFDAVKLVPVQRGSEVAEPIILDNLDAECVLSGDWEPIAKEGERSRAGGPKKKYEQSLHVIGSNHLETRNADSVLATATMALRIPADGEYNVYLSWPAIPHATPVAIVEVHSATSVAGIQPPTVDATTATGFATVFVNQTESTLSADGLTQWEPIHERVFLSGETDYVEIGNRGVDSAKHVIAADAIKFTPLDGGEEIIIDNSSGEGFEASDGWAPDQLVRNLPGRGKMFGDDILHYPPSKSGAPIKDIEVDPAMQVWARYRPIQDGQYRPGWYSVSIWTPGGHTHADWVAWDIHGSEYAPVVDIEPAPTFYTGESAALNASGTYHPAGERLTYRWSHDGHDLGLRILEAGTATPRFVVPALQSARPGWAGLIEALLQSPEFLMPSDDPQADSHTRLVRVALDLVGRVPTTEEFRRFERLGRLAPMLDTYLESDDFRDFFLHRARIALRSRGTAESDEPARLWTYIATHDMSYRELFTADYTVGQDWVRSPRRPEHGPTGMLTMKGYLVGKPGLPKYTYPAQVLTFALGMQFEVSDAVEQAREEVVSTTDPASMCYSCHKLLTPLAFQRERWDIHGHYRTVDEEHNVIDDSDRGVVPDYPFKGPGLSAFANQVVKKERFVRAFVNQHHDMLFHRQLRVLEDQREVYKELYEFAVATELKIRPLLKKMILAKYNEPSEPI